MKKSLSPLFAAVIALSFVACGEKKETTPPVTETSAPEPTPVVAAEPTPESEKPAEPAPPPAPTKDILTTATDAGNFTTLLAAIDKADLKATLSGPGPFTVFAPTDEAFAKVPKADLDKLLKDKKKLAAILTYHVVAGSVKAADFAGMPTATTVYSEDIQFDWSRVVFEGARINGATVISADIMTTNGVIHVIDTVLMPPKAAKKAS
jgi:uncharacterized surface protein with fasciclin (FAS1) repeats